MKAHSILLGLMLAAGMASAQTGSTVNTSKPTETVLESAHLTSDTADNMGEYWEVRHEELNWTLQGGGTLTGHFEQQFTTGQPFVIADSTETITSDKAISWVHCVWSDGEILDTNGTGSVDMPLELGTLTWPANNQFYGTKTSKVKLALHIGGQASIGGEVLVEVGGGSGTEELVTTPYSRDIEKPDLMVEGLGKALGSDGMAYGTAASGSDLSINLIAGVADHLFGDGAGAHKLAWVVAACAPPLDMSRTKLGIGESVYCYMTPSVSVDWSVSGGGSISLINGPATTFTASKSPSSPTVHASKEGAEVIASFNVITPSSITVVSNWDEPWGAANPNGTMMGARTHYLVVIGPTDVSFGNVTFRENVSPDIIHWPSGVETNTPQHGFPTPGCDYVEQDLISIYTSTSRIFDGTNYVPFSYSSTWTDQYQDDSGNWVDFVTRNVTREFHSDKTARVIYMGVPSINWQGPYLP